MATLQYWTALGRNPKVLKVDYTVQEAREKYGNRIRKRVCIGLQPLADPESSKVQRNEPGPISAREAKPSNAPPVTHDHEGLVHIYNKLSLLDRHLFVWILVVMATALLVGYYNPEVKEHLEVITVGSISLPIAIGLWVMLFPVLCKVRFELLGEMLRGSQLRSNLLLSLALNWVVGPALMTGLAWATLPDLPTYRTGVILIGIARCIAMVLIWNDLAKGDAELCAVLVSFNSVLQILLFTPFSIFYLRVVSGRSGVDVSIKTVSNSVLFFLGIPFAAAVVTRLSLRHGQGAKWYDTRFVPFIAPWALLGLLYTIFLMFSVQAHEIVFNIVRLCRVAVPLLLYFVIMFSSATAVCKWMKLPYAQLVTHSFTAASNNFELAIAVAIGTFGIDSHEALAATIGPLIEVPVLLALVYLTLHLKRKNII
ncbi:hypothetical protein Mapa_012336 [Marchantia paleacea]|nr:hypothetical protein Mapa_012336 [Marchantia paleacea]